MTIESADRPVSGRLRTCLHCCGLLVGMGLVAALYGPVAGYGFVNWDDTWYVVQNPLITNWRPANLWTILSEPAVKNYAPLTMLSYLVQHTLWGQWPGGYHLVGVGLHAACAILVWMLIRQLTGSRGTAWIVSALFAVHPVQVESVAWISSQKTLASSLFMLASLLYWLRSERTPRQEAWGIAHLAIALLFKASAIVVPPIVVAYDVLVAGRRPADAARRQLIPSFLCLLLLFVTMSAQTIEMGGVRDHLEFSKLHILAIDAVVLWRYVGMLIAPMNLSVLYDPPTQGIAAAVAASVVGWLAVGAMAWRLRRRQPWVAFALLTWLLLLFPVLNLFPITTLMNDRYLYLPCVVVFTAAVESIRRLIVANFVRGGVNRPSARLAMAALTLAAVASVTAYAAGTRQRLPVWKDSYSLWSDTREKAPQLAVVQIQWANTLHELNRNREAIAILQQALAAGNADAADHERMQHKIIAWRAPATAPIDF